ncbi:MAG TPA: transposase [Steroidobacter sp.]|uniref:transposase n=1 Tax=Steroidobacter sp. TaxID=1978227 RepID=UPI002ED7B1E1
MPRLPRLHIANACYHVVLRGHHGRDIFFRPADRRLLEECVAGALHHTRMRVHGYCWLNNSIDLLVQVADVPLSRFMQRIGTRYARAVQRPRRDSGQLFEHRYEARIVDVDSYFLDLLRDFHLRPVRSGIVSIPEQSRWTSHRAYLSRVPHPWLHTELGLRLLHWQPQRARELYRDFIDAGIGTASDPALYTGHRHDPRVLGDDRFLATLQWRPPAGGQPAPAAPALAAIVQEICLELGITTDQLRSVRQNRVLSRARGLITARARDAYAATLADIAKFLNRSPSALARAAERYGK